MEGESPFVWVLSATACLALAVLTATVMRRW